LGELLDDEGDEVTEELSVTDVPRERGDVDVSELVSDICEEDDATEETLRSLCAVATSGALIVCTFVVESRTGAEILKLPYDLAGLTSLVGAIGVDGDSTPLLYRGERVVHDLDIDILN